MTFDRELFRHHADRFGVSADETALERLELYARRLVETNRNVNLTAVTDPAGIAERHFADSASLLAVCDFPEGAAAVDVGTGAGFPGVVLKILRPDLRITLLDAQRKRTDFLTALTEELGLPCPVVWARAEDAARRAELRESFDFAFARAVAELRILAELCLPFLRKGGRFPAMKGPSGGEELEAARGALAKLGGRVLEVRTFTLGEAGVRTVPVIEKISQTSTKYPRPYAKIVKAPL